MALQTKDPSTAVISSVGTAVSGGTTSDTKPVITGKADAGNKVVVYDGVRPIGSVIADANGNWTITPTVDLKAGAHNFAAIAQDTAGNYGASSALVNVTITSSAVTPPTPIITDDHGLPIVAGGTTADAKPQISGSGPAGDIITVYDGATPIGSTKINPDGKWTFTPTTDLSNATHAITVTDKAPGGTEGPHSGAAGFTVDTTVPSSPTVTSATNWNGDDRIGDVPVGAVVASPDVVIFGKALAGAVVYVYDGATLVGSSVAAANGIWNFENKAFAQGSHDITATVKNAAGTESAHSNHWTFSVDTSTPAKPAAPTVTDDNGATIPAGGTTADALPHIDGKGTPGDTIKVLDNGVVIGSTTVKPDGNWSFTPTTDLNNGPHDITVIDTNPAGTSSPASDPTHITVDTSVPAKPATPVLTDASDAVIPAGSTTNDGHPHISGTGKAGDTITVYDDTKAIGSTTVQPDGKWTFTPATDLSTGAHSISVTETNAAGTPSPKSDAVPFTYSVVSGAPVIESVVDAVGTITGPIVNGGVTDDSHPTISGKGVPGYTVYIFQNGTGCGEATVDATGHWTVKLTGALSDGQHVMTATQFTGSGAQSVVSNAWTITVDTSVPAKPAAPTLSDDNGLAIPAGSTTADTHPHIDGTGGKAGDTITVYDGGKAIGSTTVNPDGTWSFKPSPDLSPGPHDITVTDTNPAGTTSPASDPTHITIDPSIPATPPAPTLSDDLGALIPAGSTTTDTVPHISGTGIAGHTITVYDGDTALGTATVAANGSWTFVPSKALPVGPHSFTVVDTNAAGTPSAHSPATSVTMAAPSITITGVYDQNHTLIPDHGSNTGTFTVEGTAAGYANGDTVSLWFAGPTAVGDPSYIRPQIYNVQIVNGKFSVVITSDTKSGTTGTGSAIFTGNAGDIAITAILQNSGYSNKSQSSPYTITETSWGPSVPAAPVITVLMADDAAWTNPDYMTQSGGTTSHTSEKLAGTGVAGTVVYLYDGATLIGSTTVTGNGTWTSNLLTFSKGTHDISATTVSGGVESAHSNHWSFTVGTASVPATPPTPYLTDDNNAVIPAGSTTNDGHPHINGTGTAGDIIKVYDNGSIIGSTTIGSDGKWMYTPSSDLATGGHSISVTESNSAGTSGQSGSIGFNFVAGTAPVTPVITAASYIGDIGYDLPSGGVAQTTYVKIAGTATAGATVYVYDGATLVASSVADTNGYWTYMIGNYSSGAHDLSATTKNAAGAESAHSNHWTFTVNTTPVVVAPTETVTISGLYDDTSGSQVLVNSGGSTSDTTPIVKGNVSSSLLSGESLVIYRDGVKVGNATVVGTSWSYNDSGVGVGNHTYTARVENSVGKGSYSGGYAFTEVAPIFSASGMSIMYFNASGNGFLMFAPYLKGAQSTIWPKINGQDVYFRIYAYSQAGVLISQVADQKANILSNGTSVGVKILDYPLNTVFVTTARLGVNGQEVIFDAHTGTYLQDIAWKIPDASTSAACDVSALPASLGGTAGLLSATHVVTDDHVLAASASASDSNTISDTTTAHHIVVGEHDAFKGTTGHDTVDLNTDPTSYFKESTAHIEGSTAHPTDSLTGLHAVNTLHLTGDHQVLDLTSLTGQTAAAKISGIEVIDLGGQHNTLKLSLVDVLNLGETDLFQKDGKQQMMVNGKEGDEVDLSNSHIAGLAEGEWQAHGTTEVGGVTYNVYEHSSANAELLVEHTVRIEMH